MPTNSSANAPFSQTKPTTTQQYQYQRLYPTDAINHFKQKSLLISANHYDVLAYEHAVAFTVTGMMQQDLLQDTYGLMQQAIKDGLPFADFKQQLMPHLLKKGWLAKGFTKTDGELDTKDYDKYLGRRLKTIYHTGKQTAYAAGKWQRIQDNKDFMPFLQYMPSLSATKRDDHTRYYGLVRPVDDPIWAKIYPPNGFGCKCWVKQLTERQAEKIGISEPLELETETVKNPHTGKMIETTKGVQFSFNHNFDRLTAMLRLARDKHGTDFAKEMADKVVTMDTIAKRFLPHWLGASATSLEAEFTDDLADVAAKHNLTQDEFMALRHYTVASNSVELSYRQLNALLNQTDVVEWEQYLSLMSARHIVDKALQKMPVYKGVVRRTLHLPQKILDSYQIGETITFRGLTSSTYGEAIDINGDANVVLTIHSKQGRLIEDISYFEGEKEVLFGSFTEFDIKSVKKADGFYRIVLEEL